MLAEPAFRELFKKECHVCSGTMQIFAALHAQGTSPDRLARTLGVDPAAIDRLAEAEWCEPHLVVRLCRHLALPIPEKCPRMTAEQG
jgi:hypothetical protein